MKRTLTLAAAFAGGLLLSTLSLSALEAGELPMLVPGEQAPAFSAMDENGTKHELSAYAGKGVVLEWTNQDCPYVTRHYDADTMEKLASQRAFLLANRLRGRDPVPGPVRDRALPWLGHERLRPLRRRVRVLGRAAGRPGHVLLQLPASVPHFPR